jgi:hypothetical protein
MNLQNRLLSSTLAAAFAATAADAQWQQAQPSASPSVRAEVAMTSFPGIGVLLFGGSPAFGSPFADTWRYNGSTWTQLAPTASPTGRARAGIVYDNFRGVAVMYGGGNTSFFGGPSIDQTWEFDGTTWSQITTTSTPGGLSLMGLAFDSTRNRTVLYGGVPNSRFPIAANGTWEYDGFNWTQVTTAQSPGPLERPAMCYHAGMGRTILFGGIDPQTGGTNTTWSYDGTNWAALPVTGTVPSARTGARMVYDSTRLRAVLYGGADPMTGNQFNDTWEFDGAVWTQIATGLTPSRMGAGMAIDATRRKTVLFGGMDATFAVLADTWEYDVGFRTYGSGCAGSNGVPTLSSTSTPRVGTTFTIQVGNLVPSASAALILVGLSDTTSVLGPLPVDLSPFGLTGCSALTSMDVLTFVAATGGNATWVFAVPALPALAGARFFNQAASFDTVNTAGLTVSNGGAATIGS